MKRVVFILGFIVLNLSKSWAITDIYHYTNVGKIALTVTNFGMFGNGFRVYDPNTGEPLPSMEYPRGTGNEHLYRAGLWVGAIDPQTGLPHVTTGVSDATSASAGIQGFEFSPTESIGDTVVERSILLTSPYYSSDAISEQDFLATYYDYLTSVPEHTPLHIRVVQRTYAWSYSYADDFVIAEFVVYNDNTEAELSDVYLGIYAELVSASREFWGEDRFNTSQMFQFKRLFYDDSLRMIYEHNSGVDTIATQYGGVKILGVKGNGIPDTLNFNFHWWTWRDMVGSVSDDIRYQIMSEDTIYPDVDEDYVMEHGYPDPISLLSVGPIPHLFPGDSITFTVAFVCGEDLDQLYKNAQWAQRAYDSDYILPAPPPPPRLTYLVQPNRVILLFDDSPESAIDPNTHKKDFEGYRIYRKAPEDTSFILLQEYDLVDSIGYNRGLPPKGYNGYPDLYYFIDNGVRNGFPYQYSVTSFDKGDPTLGLESLESSISLNIVTVYPGTPPLNPRENKKVGVYPNPYRRSSVWDSPDPYGRVLRFYNLPKRCVIYIYTLSGELIKTINHNDPILGEEKWNLITDYEQAVASGMYYFVVKNLDSGAVQRGRFVILK